MNTEKQIVAVKVESEALADQLSKNQAELKSVREDLITEKTQHCELSLSHLETV